jgi:hypothetical protein
MEKLSPELKEQWLAALRSGRYKQAESVLHKNSEDQYHHCCCLGVLEHICGTPISELTGVGMPGDLDFPKSPIQFHVSEEDDLISEDDIVNILVNMNDGNVHKGIKKHSFEEIADYIESNL